MKKKRNLTTLIVLIFTMCFPVNVFANTNNDDGGVILEELHQQTKQAQMSLNETVLISNEDVSAQSIYLDDVMKVNKEYSNIYGGSYVENDKVIVLLTNMDEQVHEFVVNNIKANVEFKICDTTLQNLHDIKAYILDFYQNYSMGTNQDVDSLIKEITVVGTYVHKNMVYVAIKGCNEKKINLFKQYVLDSPNIYFRNSNGIEDTASQVKSGQTISIIPASTTGTNYCSVGFRCKRLKSNGTYENGFITCGHNNQINWQVYSALGEYIGVVTARKNTTGGKTDASFVHVNGAGVECSNTTLHTGRTYSATHNVTNGTSVFMEGKTSGCTAGIVYATDATMTDQQLVVIFDLYEANYPAAAGDSGGIVYSKVVNTSVYKVVGIQKGIDDPSNQYYSYAVKTKNILSDLNVSVY